MEEYSFRYTDTVQPATTSSLRLKHLVDSVKDHVALVLISLEFKIKEGTSDQYCKEAKWLPVSIIGMGRLKE